RESLGDLDHLLLSDRKLAQQLFGRDEQAKALQVRFAVRPHLPLIDQPQRSAYQRFATHEDVGSDIEVVQNVKFLMDKTDAQSDGVRYAGDGDLFSLKEDLTF